MLKKYLQKRKIKKLLKMISLTVITDIADSNIETIDFLRVNGTIRSKEHESAISTELTNFGFWLFQSFNKFPESYQKPVLDALFDTFFTQMRKNGANFELRKMMSNEINLRLKTYNDVFRDDKDMSRVFSEFMKFLSETSGDTINLDEMLIPVTMMDNFIKRISKYPDIINK